MTTFAYLELSVPTQQEQGHILDGTGLPSIQLLRVPEI